MSKVYKNNDSCEFLSQQYIFCYHTTEKGEYSYSDNGKEKYVLHSINPAVFKMSYNIKRKISDIVTPDLDEIPERRPFVSHESHLKASAELIADM